EVTPTEMVGEGKVHVKVIASYCKALPDVAGGEIYLLELDGSVYLDRKEINHFEYSNGKTISVGKTEVVTEFDWPLDVGLHNITLKVKNGSGLLGYIKTKTDSVIVKILPLEYPLKLTEISCDNLNFNFETMDMYSQEYYASSLKCALTFRNVDNTQIYI
ncbi:hypothetical protein, partial [Thermococcus sp. GR4]